MTMRDVPFWNREIETAERSRIEQIQLQRLQETIGWALKTILYRKRLNQAGINSPDDIKSRRRKQSTPKDRFFEEDDRLERAAGIEPARKAWEAFRLPLHHARGAGRQPNAKRCALKGEAPLRSLFQSCDIRSDSGIVVVYVT